MHAFAPSKEREKKRGQVGKETISEIEHECMRELSEGVSELTNCKRPYLKR